MEISVGNFLEDPKGYIDRTRDAAPVYPWMTKLLGEHATSKIFSDLAYQDIQSKREHTSINMPRIVNTTGAWVRASNVRDVCNWRISPQKPRFWELLHHYKMAGNLLYESDKEWLLDRCYSVNIPGFILVPPPSPPPWANDIFDDIPFR